MNNMLDFLFSRNYATVITYLVVLYTIYIPNKTSIVMKVLKEKNDIRISYSYAEEIRKFGIEQKWSMYLWTQDRFMKPKSKQY